DIEGKLGLEFADRQHAHAVLGAAQHAGLDQRLGVHRLLGLELLGIDRRLDAAERHGREALGEDVVEAARGQAAVERHLATLEAVDRHAGAGFLALDAAAAGLALARADAATDALLG